MLLNNTIWLTILIILGVSLLLMVLNRRTRDRCLKDFDGFVSTFIDRNSKHLWGRLKVYTTGLEFKYHDDYYDTDGHIETSSILYRQELVTMWMLVRFHDELTERNQARRLKQLEKSFHPKFYRKAARTLRNLFISLKDAFTDITSAVISAVSASSSTAKVIAGQQKHLVRAESELVGYAGTDYDPILERHIGEQVVLEITNPAGQKEERTGILKEYSGDFLEVMGMKFRDGDNLRECDMIVPRAISFVRHSNEPVKKKQLEKVYSES